MEPQINKTPQNFWKEREANLAKPTKRLKSPKKPQPGELSRTSIRSSPFHEGRKSSNDVKIEDVFLNSEYFKYQKNASSLSFCSGDNGENQWTVNPKYEFPFRPKTGKVASYPSETIKSDTAMLAGKEAKLKKNNSQVKETLWEGILAGKGRPDHDLITLITEQMFLAERELQVTRTHLIETIGKLNERDLEIIQLHEKIQNLQKSRKVETKDETPTKSSEDYQRLVKASEKLKKQVKDMEEFLNDYGLVWVGDKETTQKPDFDKLVKSFQRLNAVASQPKIIQTTRGAKFELPREIPVALYANGVLVRSEFREYSKVSTTMFLQDIEDGYFPSELQVEFPEGVPFEVFDKRNETYHQTENTPVFHGRGNRLGSTIEGKPSSVVYLEPVKHFRHHESSLSLRSESPLKRLQKKRIRNVSLSEEKNLLSTFTSKFIAENDGKEEGRNTQGQLLRVKIRYGKEKTESFVLEIKENEKLHAFLRALQRKLCEKYHEQCILDFDSNNRSTDFEIHVYGKTPFRLSDHLNEYPRDCGIVDSCLINVTEI